MNLKNLDINPYSLSEKVIENGNNSFKLWLEFEISTPWNNLENDFANIIVDTLDGRKYGINVWTFEFLKTAEIEEIKEGNNNYIIPPDLFVKKLTRNCIEETIEKLLKEGDLETILNRSIFGLNFLEPYWDAIEMEKENIESFIKELKIELSDSHFLNNESFEFIAKKMNNDDIVLELEDGRIAVVHLTWKSRKEVNNFPISRIYKDKIDFWNKEMKQDIFEFKE